MRERRKFRRYNALLAVKYKTDDGDIYGYSLTKDISEGGINMPLDKYIPPKTKITVEVDLPMGEGKIISHALVVWSRKNKYHWEPLYSAGLEFEDVDSDSVNKLIDCASAKEWEKNDFEKDLEGNRTPIIE